MKTGINTKRDMKHQYLYKVIAALAVVLGMAACAQEEPLQEVTPEEPEVSTTQPVTRMVLNGGIRRWDAPSTKGDAEEWEYGDVIWIMLSNGTETKKVNAWYDGDNWTLNYDGNFDNFASGMCTCYFFQGLESTSLSEGKVYSLNGRAIYQDDNAVYSVTDGVLQVGATLLPKTGRIRFTSAPYSENYYPDRLKGITRYTQVALDDFSFTESDDDFYPEIDGNYTYGFFTDPEHPSLIFTYSGWGPGDADYFERTFQENLLTPGKGITLYTPNPGYYNEWTRTAGHVDIDGEDFRYILPGTFTMGGDDAPPAHTVTLTKPFYISRAEISRDMWNNVTGEALGDGGLPLYGMSYDDVQAFITLLNKRYEGKYLFRLPTEAEWEYVARGANWSNATGKSYKYSGSDSWDNVAAYNGYNKEPEGRYNHNGNACNIFDMSGNVSEWCSDWYGPYPDEPVTDPKGAGSGDVHVRRGGDRFSGEKYLTVTYRDIETATTLAGLRLVMEPIQ